MLCFMSKVLELQLSSSYINRFVCTMENICQKLDISGNLAKLGNIKVKYLVKEIGSFHYDVFPCAICSMVESVDTIFQIS